MNESANNNETLKIALLLLLLSMVCLLEASYLGGVSGELVPTQNVREIVLRLRHDVENEIGRQCDSLDAHRFKGQVVAGYLYYISAIARTGGQNTYVHLKVLDRPWSDGLKLVGFKNQVDQNTPITFHDYSPTLAMKSFLGRTEQRNQ